MISPFDREARPSDSSFVEQIWRNSSAEPLPFMSLAVSHWEMVVTRCRGSVMMTIRGPETKASPAYCPEDAEFFGIFFKFGTYMPHLPTKNLVDSAINLPEAGSRSFWLNGAAWEYPTYDNADVFVKRLIREGLLVHDSLVHSAIHGHPNDLSLRSVQRRILHTTGLTQGGIRQIERALQAATLLKQGMPLLDTVYEAGYADQPHMTRALRNLIGYTPAQIKREDEVAPVGFLYSTPSLEPEPLRDRLAQMRHTMSHHRLPSATPLLYR